MFIVIISILTLMAEARAIQRIILKRQTVNSKVNQGYTEQFNAAISPPITSNPTPQLIGLHNFLKSHYKLSVLSGQTTWHYDDLAQLVGQHPILRGFDFQNYSPHNPWFNWSPYDDGTVQAAINWYEGTSRQGVVHFFWHWFSPMGGSLRTSTFYTAQTDFDVTQAVIPNTAQYNATIRDIDAIAAQLTILRNRRVPILFRPLHQAGGAWFWWGAKGPQAAIKLWKLVQQRLMVTHGMNNLLWCWSTPQPAWYPGNLLVDTIGFDSYPGAGNYDCRIDQFVKLDQLVGSIKMVQLTQNGPLPDMPYCLREGAPWALFMGWNDLIFQQNDQDHLKRMFSAREVLTLERIGVSGWQQIQRTNNQKSNYETVSMNRKRFEFMALNFSRAPPKMQN